MDATLPRRVSAAPLIVSKVQVAAREGLEPPTLALGKPCSIRLSYRAALSRRGDATRWRPLQAAPRRLSYVAAEACAFRVEVGLG